MRIRIGFYESAGYTFESIENFIRINENGDKYFKVSGVEDIIGKELEKIICEDYFNGAELACRYIGYSLDNEYFEFEIIPN